MAREQVNILFVCPNSQLGGGEIALYNFLSRIDRKRFRPLVVTSSQGPLVRKLEQINIPVAVIKVSGFRSPTNALRALWRLKQLITAEQIALVNSYGVNIVTCLLAWRLRLPLIVHVHTVDRLKRLDELCLRLPGSIVAVCESVKNNLVDSGVLAKKIQVIPNGIDVTPNPGPLRHPTIREEFSIDPDAKIVGYLGRIAEGKGIHVLIEAAPAILSKHPNTIFLVAGKFQNGEREAARYRNRLVALCKQFQIEDHVLFCGFRDDVDSLMQQIDIVALPSRLEAFPMTILEAMASGTPVVATRVGGVPELLTEDTGVMVPPCDPRGLAAAIIALLDHPQRARELGERARERAQHFPMAQTVRKLEDLQLKSLNRDRHLGRA